MPDGDSGLLNLCCPLQLSQLSFPNYPMEFGGKRQEKGPSVVESQIVLSWKEHTLWEGFFSGFGWWFLFPLPHQMDSWIFYPLFFQLSHHASLELSFSLFNFYNFPSPFPDGVSSSLCFTQARNCFGKTLLALSHEELNIALEGNSRFFTFKILWHSVCFSQSSWVKKLVPRMGGSIGIAFDSLLGSA